jgi:hypothetical protein
MKNSKAAVDVITSILIVMIALGLTATAYTWGLPLIQKQQDTAVVGRVASYFDQNNQNSLPSSIEFIANNGGEQTFSMDVTGIWTLNNCPPGDLPSCNPTALSNPSSTPCGRAGDVDSDGSVTSTDATLASQIAGGASGFSSAQKENADVDGDGLVKTNDATLITRYVNREITSFPTCNSLQFSFFSKVSNIATKDETGKPIGYISLTPGAKCPPEEGILGKDKSSAVCAKAEPFQDGYQITYKIWFRELSETIASRGFKIDLTKHQASLHTSDGKTIKISRQANNQASVGGKTLIIPEMKILLE